MLLHGAEDVVSGLRDRKVCGTIGMRWRNALDGQRRGKLVKGTEGVLAVVE